MRPNDRLIQSENGPGVRALPDLIWVITLGRFLKEQISGEQSPEDLKIID